ncbi:MAG: hypothetical protein ACXVCY_06825 [Pseudobdellovibrionaceae bacterium]
MGRLNKIILIFCFFLNIAGCGVKGAPLPPLNPAPLGHGEPVSKEIILNKTSKKSNVQKQDSEGSSPADKRGQ